ncbi:hypothetical protein PBY51_001224 [Eleginops maclovinus]|uniref:Uncharacterized protein n=1 Tax=Eleginops maclovinus TaxID=56733 RepID=A0AAN7XPC4_ELEMC|nr:hypothetical protein PBY51_001224 [Eleginops maclovinus]
MKLTSAPLRDEHGGLGLESLRAADSKDRLTGWERKQVYINRDPMLQGQQSNKSQRRSHLIWKPPLVNRKLQIR